MKRTNSILCFGGLCAAALLAFLLQLWQVTTGRAGALLPLCSLVLLIGLILLARNCLREPQLCAGLGSGLGYVIGGLLLTVAGGLHFQAGDALAQITAALGVLAGIVTVVQGTQRIRRKQSNLLLGCIIVLWLVLQIIGDFKSWSTNPAVLDYCYPLFALLCSMAACFHMAGCLAGLGKGRLTLFWCGAGVFFCAIALADCDLTSCLLYLGLLLLNLQNTWCLLTAK